MRTSRQHRLLSHARAPAGRRASLAAVIMLATVAWPPLAATVRSDGAVALAIIVNESNTAPDPSSAELRAMLTLDRQFWPDGESIVIFLPPSSSAAMAILLDRVYAMAGAQLRKLWVHKLFRGSIPAIPTTIRNNRQGACVRRSKGGLSAVLASQVPAGVRVLKVDGRSPMDPDYPLKAESPQ